MGWGDGYKWVERLLHEDLCLVSRACVKLGMVELICDPSFPILRWEVEAGEPLGIYRPASPVYTVTQRHPASNKVDDKDQHPDFHMCTVTCVAPYVYPPTGAK